MADRTTMKHLCLLGNVGHGKSSFGNRILDKPEAFASGTTTGEGLTKICSTVNGTYKNDVNKMTLCVTDTPGANDSGMPAKEMRSLLATAVLGMALGFHRGISCFVLCVAVTPGARVPQSLLDMMKDYQKVLGDSMWKHSVIVITRWDPVPFQKEEQEQTAVNVKAKLKAEFGVDLPLFKASIHAKDYELEDIFATWLESKTTYFHTSFFDELRLAYESGGAARALGHIGRKMSVVLSQKMSELVPYLKAAFKITDLVLE